ncbi:MAG: glycoside hydrolase family 10 protein [Acutalibacteraceae bacterium]
MKRILILVGLFIFLCGCVDLKIDNSTQLPSQQHSDFEEENKNEFKGIWLTVYELAPESDSEKEYIKKADDIMNNIGSFGFTDIFIQVRANCDSIYDSDIFPPCYMYADENNLYFDALSILCKKAHEFGLKVHAWINPYRICSDINIQPLNIPKGIEKDDIIICGDGRYLNPSAEKTNAVILGGIREILENYNIDGIHIDDYFYPVQSESIDKKEYSRYLKKGGKSELSDFRRNNVSSLISSMYSLVKSYGDGILFSISPCADIEKDREKLYADVGLWCSEKGYCDMIIPQIYFGFENENMPFCETFDKWKKLTENSSVKLCIGLSIYKTESEDKYAGGSGKDEWKNNSDIIKRQIEYLRENDADGFSVFSYNYVFGNKNFTKDEVKNLKSVI